MTKEEVLSILYSERSRLQEKYNTPGWTVAVVIATIATIFFQGVNLFLENFINWNLSFAICFLLFDIVILIGLIYSLRKNGHSPVFAKHLQTEKNATIFIIVYLIVHLLWMCVCNGCVYVNLACLFILGYFIYLYIKALIVLSNEKGFKNTKPHKVSYIYPILLLFVCVNLGIYIYNEYMTNTLISSVKMGMFLFALLFLVNHLFKCEFELLKDIDRLIDRTLYDDIDNYDKVLEDLEQMTVGVDVERYLFKQYHNVVESSVFIIKKEYERINEILLVKGKVDDFVLDVECSFKEIDSCVEFFKNSKKFINDMMASCYGRDKQIRNNKLSKMMNEMELYIALHTTMYSKYKVVTDFELYRIFFIEEYRKILSKEADDLN